MGDTKQLFGTVEGPCHPRPPPGYGPEYEKTSRTNLQNMTKHHLNLNETIQAFVRNLGQGLVLKAPNIWISCEHLVVVKSA